MIFLLMGYWFSHSELKPKWRYGLYLGRFFGWLLYFAGTIVLSYRDGTFNDTFQG